MIPIKHNLRWLLLVVGLLAACGGRDVGTPRAEAPGTAVLAAGERPISFMVFGDPAEYRAYLDLAAAFEAAHPPLKVDLLHIPDQGDYRKRLAADFAAGAPADVVLLNYRRYAGFATRGLLEPLGPYLRSSQVISESDFYAEAMQPFRWRREILCIPQNISSLAVYFNQALFEQARIPLPEAGWTRDDFLAAALGLTRDLDGDGRIDQYGLGIEPSLVRLAPFIWQNKGDLVNDGVAPSELVLEEPPALSAVRWFVDLQVRHHVVPDAEAEAAEPSEDRFLNGRLAMFVNSRRGVPTYRQITEFAWDVAPLPEYRGSHTNVLHADGYCMAAAAPNKAAVWAFIEFANSPTGQAIVAASGRTVPSLVEVAQSDAFLDPAAQPAHSEVFLDAIPYLRAVPVLENWVEIETIANDELERAFYGRASVDEAMHAAAARSDEYFAPSR